MRVLLVEDDELLGEGVRTALRRAAFTVDWIRDGAGALDAIRDGGVDLVVLDLGLPRLDGMDVIRAARRSGSAVPILILSARERASDRTLGLDAGADDFLSKPFDTQELLARVRALLRRSNGQASPRMQIGGLVLDPAALSVTWHGREVELPRREFALLRILMEASGRIISREAVQQRLYGWDDDVTSNTVDVHVHHLRRKFPTGLIRTVRGVGYGLDETIAMAAPDPESAP